MARSPRSSECGGAIAARSFKSVRLWLIAEYRCNRLTARPSTPFKVLSISLRCELIHDKSRVRVTMIQMPALNTPLFGWVKSRLPRKAQPVPPIFQPEVAAEAIVYASHHKRREIYVGMPTVEAIIGNKLFPGLLDRRPGRSTSSGQSLGTCQAITGRMAISIRAPRDEGPQLWTSTHRGWLAAAGLLLAGGTIAEFWQRRLDRVFRIHLFRWLGMRREPSGCLEAKPIHAAISTDQRAGLRVTQKRVILNLCRRLGHPGSNRQVLEARRNQRDLTTRDFIDRNLQFHHPLLSPTGLIKSRSKQLEDQST